MMKIIFVLSHLTKYNGLGKFIVDYANHFCEQGHDMTIIVQRIDKKIYIFNNNVKLVELGGYLPKSSLHWLNFFKFKDKYIKALSSMEKDIIVSFLFPITYFCSKLKSYKNTKHVYYCNEPYRLFYDKQYLSNTSIIIRFAALFLKLLFKKYDIIGTINADYIICNSKNIKNKVEQIYGKSGIVHYIGTKIIIDKETNNVNHFNLKQELNLDKNENILFSLGLSHHSKGVSELIYIFKRILNFLPNTILLVGGNIEKRNYKIMRDLIKKLNIPKNKVIFYGFIKHENLEFFYSQSDLTLYTAVNEPFGLIPLESMAYGTPVIAFEGGPSETILDGKTGYVIKYGLLDVFASKCLKILNDKKLNHQLSEMSVKHIIENFSYTICIKKLEDIFKKVLKY